MYGGRLLKAYGASIDVQRWAKILKAFKAMVFFQERVKDDQNVYIKTVLSSLKFFSYV